MNTDQPRRKRILVIEDDLQWQTIIRHILLTIDNRLLIRTASVAEVALDIIADGSGFDLIISDYLLEGTTTGADIFSFCLSNKNPTPFIILSGRSEVEIREALKTRDDLRVISKTAHFREIRERLSEFLASSES